MRSPTADEAIFWFLVIMLGLSITQPATVDAPWYIIKNEAFTVWAGLLGLFLVVEFVQDVLRDIQAKRDESKPEISPED